MNFDLVPPPDASIEAKRLHFYRRFPSKWAEHHLNIQFSRCRERAELETWLDAQPPDMHQWIRRRLQADDPTLQLGSDRQYQAEWLDAMATPGWYVFQCCNGGRKTATAAIKVLHFLDNFPGGRCVTTAGTWSQLREQLWREIPLWASKSKLPITANAVPIQRTQIDLGSDWVAFGRAATSEATFEGVHAKYILLILDEAKAIKPEVFAAVRRILRGHEDGAYWVVVLSSPGSPSGPFYDLATSPTTVTMKLSAYECAHISLEEISRDAIDLGDRSPLFVSMDCGEFPDTAEDTVIPLIHAQAAANRQKIVSTRGDRFLGVDIARYGSDETVLMELKGRLARMVANYRGKDTVWTSGRIQTAYSESGPYKRVMVDDTGVGGGVTDQLRAADRRKRGRFPITGVVFNDRKSVRRRDVHHDRKTEMYFWLADALKEGHDNFDDAGAGIAIPNDTALISQLTCQKFKYGTNGEYWMESHEDLRKRTLPSPDRADALALAHYGKRARTRTVRGTPHDVSPTDA